MLSRRLFPEGFTLPLPVAGEAQIEGLVPGEYTSGAARLAPSMKSETNMSTPDSIQAAGKLCQCERCQYEHFESTAIRGSSMWRSERNSSTAFRQ